MSRDGRGRPGRIVLKNQPRLRLVDVLRRRRTTLKDLIAEIGITTYAGLDAWCARLGVLSPSLDEFEKVVPHNFRVNSPLEGVVVLQAPPVVAESTGEYIDLSQPIVTDEPTFDGPTEPTQKKRRPKKDDVPSVD